MQIDEDSRPEHASSLIAPNTESVNANAREQGDETLTEVSQQDLVHNDNLFQSNGSSVTGLSVRFERSANPKLKEPDEYRKLMRGLNSEQRAIVMYHRNWCKKVVKALKNGKPVKPYYVFLSGPGGVGKSHVIRLIQSDTLRLIRQSGTVEPDDVLVLLTAPTGVAAFNVNGITLHSAFLLGGSGSLWQDEFEMVELDEIMSQKHDSAFAELLCRVRTASCTEQDIAVLESRVIEPDSADYPNEVLHVYKVNVDVDQRDEFMLSKLDPGITRYHVKAKDAITGQTQHIDLATLSNKRTDTGGLHGVLNIACGAKVMLTTNADVSDGLVNGARGKIVHIVTNSNNDVTIVLVKFDNEQLGVKVCQSSQYRASYPNVVPLKKVEVVFLARGKRGSEITRVQCPLTLSWATTIHKVQGLILDAIVVDMKGTRFNAGQIYVALSRARALTWATHC